MGLRSDGCRVKQQENYRLQHDPDKNISTGDSNTSLLPCGVYDCRSQGVLKPIRKSPAESDIAVHLAGLCCIPSNVEFPMSKMTSFLQVFSTPYLICGAQNKVVVCPQILRKACHEARQLLALKAKGHALLPQAPEALQSRT